MQTAENRSRDDTEGGTFTFRERDVYVLRAGRLPFRRRSHAFFWTVVLTFFLDRVDNLVYPEKNLFWHQLHLEETVC